MLEHDFRKIDLNLLIVLRSLLSTSHVGQTAKRLGMSQPATSRALAALREIFDDRLFVKSGSKMTPTPRALALREPLENALSVLLRVFEPPDTFDIAASRRRFRLATTDYGATVILPRLASTFFAESPNADLDVQPFSTSSFSDLGSNDLDILLYSDNPIPEALRAKEIYREQFACLARTDHPVTAAGRAKLSLEDYLRFTHIMVTITGGRTGPIDRALSEIGQQRRIGLVLPYFAAAALAAAKSDLLLTMPYRAAEAFSESMDLVLMSPPLELSDFGYRMVWHERVHDDPGHAWFRNKIAQHAKQS